MKLVHKNKNLEVKFCRNLFSKIKGLMFSFPTRKGLVLVNNKEDYTSIHMFFVFYSIDVAFLNENFEIVDFRKNVRPFTLLIKPKNKAKYIVEVPCNHFDFRLGEIVKFI